MYNTYENCYDVLADILGIDEEALNLTFAVGGCNVETAQRILFYYTGFTSFEGFMEETFGEEGWMDEDE